MLIVVTIVHVLACIILVLTVLLQAGKGADMGAVFGGASTTIFGSSGAGNFLTRLTTGAAIVFMATSLALTYGSTRSTTATLMPDTGVPQAASEPVVGGAGDVAGEAAPAAEGAPAGDAAAPAEEAPAGEAPAAAPEAAPPAAP